MMVMTMATTPSVNASRRPLVIVALRFLGAGIIRRGARPDNGVPNECLMVGNRSAALQGGWGGARVSGDVGVGRTATQGLSGRVRIAATNALAEEVLAPRLAQLLLSNPGLVIDLLTSTHTVNFSRWRRTWPSSCESRAWRLCHRAAGIDPALPFRARRRFRSRTTRGRRAISSARDSNHRPGA